MNGPFPAQSDGGGLSLLEQTQAKTPFPHRAAQIFLGLWGLIPTRFLFLSVSLFICIDKLHMPRVEAILVQDMRPLCSGLASCLL